MHTRNLSIRPGFTLVEMLVVIAIIGILVALLIPTVATVMWRVRNAAVATELQDLARGIEAYKSFANDYPPDFTNSTALMNHMTKAYPRNTRPVTATSNDPGWWSNRPSNNISTRWSTDTTNNLDPRDPPYLDPAEAMVFWLSLVSTNPRDPLGGADAAYQGERKTFFEFKADRLVDLDNDGWQEYVPQYGKDQPYVYFDGRVAGGIYAYSTAMYPKVGGVQPTPVASPPTSGVVRPYRSITKVDVNRDNNRTRPYNSPPLNPPEHNIMQWINPGKFQIVSAGQDNEWGFDYVVSNTVVFKTFPEPNYVIKGADEDNLADFSEMKTLGDSQP